MIPTLIYRMEQFRTQVEIKGGSKIEFQDLFSKWKDPTVSKWSRIWKIALLYILACFVNVSHIFNFFFHFRCPPDHFLRWAWTYCWTFNCRKRWTWTNAWYKTGWLKWKDITTPAIRITIRRTLRTCCRLSPIFWRKIKCEDYWTISTTPPVWLPPSLTISAIRDGRGRLFLRFYKSCKT